jgi:hypothetical protein
MPGFAKVNAFTVCLVTAAGTYEGDCEMEIDDNEGIIDDEAEKIAVLKNITNNKSISLANVTFHPGSLPHHSEAIPVITIYTNHIIGVYLKDHI